MVDSERSAFSDLADSLTAQQWDAQTLCSAWRTRDVVAHLTQGSTLSTGALMLLLAKHGFRVNAMLEKEAIKGGNHPTDELRRQLRATQGLRSTPPATKPEDVLLDFVVHQQDVRRPLGIRRSVPALHLRVALVRLTEVKSSILPGKTRSAGLHFRASDIGWDHGEGADVEGPGEAILMTLAGRAIALSELSGPGVESLRTRVAT
jgi:uncharacterized protein (TIGR03083 family)